MEPAAYWEEARALAGEALDRAGVRRSPVASHRTFAQLFGNDPWPTVLSRPIPRATRVLYRLHLVVLLLRVHMRHLVTSLLFLAGCALLDGTCPCGADRSVPLGEHDLGFAGDHFVDDQCVCRCGDDEPTQLPKDRACSEYESECEDARGVTQTAVCN